jgi:hypothetical protein
MATGHSTHASGVWYWCRGRSNVRGGKGKVPTQWVWGLHQIGPKAYFQYLYHDRCIAALWWAH